MTATSPEAAAPYAAYNQPGPVIDRLYRQQFEVLAIFAAIPEEKAGFRYAPEKWSLRQLLGHMIDTERIMSYRPLSFARAEKQPLPGFEEDEYVAAAAFDDAALSDLMEDYRVQRMATLRLARSFTPRMLDQEGTANNRKLRVQQLLELIVNHERHHLKILRERYLPALSA